MEALCCSDCMAVAIGLVLIEVVYEDAGGLVSVPASSILTTASCVPMPASCNGADGIGEVDVVTPDRDLN